MCLPKFTLSIILLGLLPCTFGLLEHLQVPKFFAQCLYSYYKKTRGIRFEVALNIYNTCHQVLRWKTSMTRQYPGKNVTRTAISYTGGLINKLVTKASEGRRLRKKRQAGPPIDNRHERKEYRLLTDAEREKFHAALHALKYVEQIDGESKFDILASFHTGTTQYTAHGGCNFALWHRIYLMMFEEALKEVDPTVIFPYWDSTLESNMGLDNAPNSLIFHADFMGTSNGFVETGPAANWNTSIGLLSRNVGVSGRPMTEEEVRNVTKQMRMKDICGDEAPTWSDLEFIHGPTHLFVDGNMGIIETASDEPLFYMHHNFVDLVYELYRENARANGTDVENDYPELFGDFYHAPDMDMGEMMEGLIVRDGLKDDYTKDIYKYAPRPSCSATNPNCGSPYLACYVHTNEENEEEYRCRSKSIEEYEEFKNGGGVFTGQTTTTSTTTTTTVAPTTTTTQKPCPTLAPPVPPPKKYYGGGRGLHQPIQNSFCTDGKKDVHEWIYIPIKITVQRAPDFKRYASYPVVNGQKRTTSDIYSSSGYDRLNRYMRPGQPKNYGNCKSSYSGAGEIYIQTDGLNYDGTYKEYAIVDHRLAVSMSIAHIAIKSPRSGQSDVLISAYDSCGRVCRPSCLVPRTNLYRPCAGAIRVSTRRPLMFGNDFGESILGIWDFDTVRTCPQFNTSTIYVSFFCDYSDRWPWIVEMRQKGARDPIEPPVTPNLHRRRRHEISAHPRTTTSTTTTTTTTTPPPLPLKMMQECELPRKGCIIEREDCNSNCEHGKYYPCKYSCNRFARCWANRYFVSECYKSHLDLKQKRKCGKGQGHCTNEQWEIIKTGRRRHFGNRLGRQRFGRRQGFGK